MFRYMPVKLENSDDTPDTPVSYGLLAEENKNDKWIPVAITSDISGDICFVQKLSQDLTERQIDPDHLLEVLANYSPDM